MIRRFLFSIIVLSTTSCFQDDEDIMMLHIYHKHHEDIEKAVTGTEISESYIAALISLESSPPGNPNSARFESEVYIRLVQLRDDGKPFGVLSRKSLKLKSDKQLREYATSYGLTQIMGFHCLDLGCNIEDLKGAYHLQWAVTWMLKNYRSHPAKKDWASCFRIHNTGHPSGQTSRRDYVERGLSRMKYYDKWKQRKGKFV